MTIETNVAMNQLHTTAVVHFVRQVFPQHHVRWKRLVVGSVSSSPKVRISPPYLFQMCL